MLSQHSTSDPRAFWEQVKHQLREHRERKAVLWLSAMPRTWSPSRHSDIDRYMKKGDGFFIIYDYKEDMDEVFF